MWKRRQSMQPMGLWSVIGLGLLAFVAGGLLLTITTIKAVRRLLRRLFTPRRPTGTQ